MMQSLPHNACAPVAHIISPLLTGLQSILREQLIGIYLHGSLISGDFDPDISDIDLVVVLTQALDDLQFAALHQLHSEVVRRHPTWDNRLELAYISRDGLRNFRDLTSTIGIISPGEPFHLIPAGKDWLISWYTLRAYGVALHGPPIHALLDAIPMADYVEALQEHLQHYRMSVKKNHGKPALAYIVLTVARGAYTIVHKQSTSKIKAAAWAKEHFPQWSDLLDRALRWRVGACVDSLTAEQIRPQVAAYVDDMLSGLPK